MLVFLVKGLFGQLQFPYAQFPCDALAGDQMYEPFWDAVGRIELCGFRVLALTCDGLVANRRLFRLHSPGSQSLVHKVVNPFAPERFIFFFVDPPHLLKTVRNCWTNNKRHLWEYICIPPVSPNHYYSCRTIIQCNGKEIKWRHLIDLYYRNHSSKYPGLALLPKVKYEHVRLTSFSKMRVDLAAQVILLFNKNYFHN